MKPPVLTSVKTMYGESLSINFDGWSNRWNFATSLAVHLRTTNSGTIDMISDFAMKKVFLVCLFIIAKVGIAQSFELQGSDTLNHTDANGLKQKHWVYYGKDKKLPGYKENDKVEEGPYVDSKKVGIWKSYFVSGKVKNELTYNNNRPSGYAKMYYENGNISEEGVWENNRWVGEYKYYYDNGQLSYEWKYNKDGKREGVQKYYHPNGKVMIEGDWKEGKEAGVLKEYYEDGTLKSEKNFKDGSLDIASVKLYEKKEKTVEPKKEDKLETPEVKETPKEVKPGYLQDGFNRVLGRDGKPVKEGTFKNGLLIDGKQYEYEAGKLTKTLIYKGGKVIEIISEK